MSFDWTALPLSGWIWTGEPHAALVSEAQLVYFRKTLVLETIPDTFSVHLSADSRYKFYVNGSLVETGPEKGDGKVWFYETVDLAKYLRAGENILAAIVLRYPLSGDGNHSIWRTETPGFYLKGDWFVDGHKQEFLADGSWKFHRSATRMISESPYFAPLHIFEEAVGEDWQIGWLLSGYDDADWQPAVPYLDIQISKAVSPGNLLPRPIPSLYRQEKSLLHPVVSRESANASAMEGWTALLREKRPYTVAAHAKEVIELSAGEETTGFVRLALAGGREASVKLLYAESYSQGESADPWDPGIKLDREDSAQGHLQGFSDHFIPVGLGTPEQPESYEPFWFRTLRFAKLEIETGDEPLTLLGITFTETGYPLKVRTHVETSDPSLSEIRAISERTLRRCMHETYEDCPYYEQLQYVMDSRSQMLFTYAVAADDRLARKCMDDFKRSARYDGLLNASYPSYGPNVIPGFSIYYIWMLHDHMMYFGDRELVRYHLPTVDGILEYFRRTLDKDGLVGRTGGYNGRARYWSFIDWVPGWDSGVPLAPKEGPIAMESFLYCYGLMAAADLARYVGRTALGDEYEVRAEHLRRDLRRTCLGKNGLYKDGPKVDRYSEHCQVFAVLTKTAAPDEAHSLMEEITANEYPHCSVAMAYYLFRALEQTGLYERTDRLWDTWRDMVNDHLTTSVESQDHPRSDCHAWGALALYELPCTVLGVRPTQPGFAAFTVAPVPGALTHAAGTVITPKGTVAVSWTLDDQGNPQTQWELLSE